MYKSLSFSSFGSKDVSNIDSWRSKIEVPVFAQGIGGRKGAITLKYRPILAAILILFGILLVYSYISRTYDKPENRQYSGKISKVAGLSRPQSQSPYNHTYPLTKPVVTANGLSFRIGLITDMDTESKNHDKADTWNSILLYGNLSYNKHTNKVSVLWENPTVDQGGIKLSSSYSYKGRGMELSDLIVFDGRVFTVDDRTGLVFQIIGHTVVPWAILSDGNGKEAKGFKGEWMAVKDRRLYIGGLGKEWTTSSGEVLHSNPQWIKILDTNRAVTDVDWISHYKEMLRVSKYTPPGYIIHESAVWSDVHRAWFFLPRRASHEKYDDKLDEMRATNLLFRCSEDFSDVKVARIGKIEYPARGFSSFKFIPGTGDQVLVALKTEEVKGQTKSYITAFTLDGNIVMSDTLVSLKYKYEGVEFL